MQNRYYLIKQSYPIHRVITISQYILIKKITVTSIRLSYETLKCMYNSLFNPLITHNEVSIQTTSGGKPNGNPKNPTPISSDQFRSLCKRKTATAIFKWTSDPVK